MNKGKRLWLLPLFLAISLACELLVFNLKPLTSLGGSWTALPKPEISGSLTEGKKLTLLYSGLNQRIDWAHIAIEVQDKTGKTVETVLAVKYSDDGNDAIYRAGTLRYTLAHDGGSYFRVNSYGKIHDLIIQITAPEAGCSYWVAAAEINGSVPFRISIPRIAGIFALLLLCYLLRPSSVLHDNRLWNRYRWRKGACVLLILLLNAYVLYGLSQSSTAYAHIPDRPSWAHHGQYAKLARALSEGKTWIDTPEQAEVMQWLIEMENPYDTDARNAFFSEKGAVSPWDTALYGNHLYVYFGVVPVLLTYLPYYLLTGHDLRTVYVAWLSFVLILIAAFACMRALIRRYFPRVSFPTYVLLSVLLGNCTGPLCNALSPSFYQVPIMFALAFALFALAFWLSASARWMQALGGSATPPADPDTLCFAPVCAAPHPLGISLRICLGSLMAALVAGCRPQFLVFTALALPIFGPFFRAERRRAVTLRRALCFALPYVAVAIPLMYYNAIRFSSPFDFGANYNLTTNDMPRRGFQLTRLPDGLFAYLLALPNIKPQFPYLAETNTGMIYMGKTIAEAMYGGALTTFPFLWLIFLARRARGVLREKKLRLFYLLPLVLAVVVVIADTEMAGILWRYTSDYYALLYLSAILVFCALLEEATPRQRSRLLVFLTATTLISLAFCLLISLPNSGLNTYAPQTYFRLRDLLSWG